MTQGTRCTYKDIKDGDTKKKNSWESYIIKFPKAVKVILGIAVVFFGYCFAANVLTYYGIRVMGKGVDIGTVTFFGIYWLFNIFGCMTISMWKIKVEGEDIWYRGYFGVTKHYVFAELDRVVEKPNGMLIAYKNGKRIFSIESILFEGIFFRNSAKEYNVKIEDIEKNRRMKEKQKNEAKMILYQVDYIKTRIIAGIILMITLVIIPNIIGIYELISGRGNSDSIKIFLYLFAVSLLVAPLASACVRYIDVYKDKCIYHKLFRKKEYKFTDFSKVREKMKTINTEHTSSKVKTYTFYNGKGRKAFTLYENAPNVTRFYNSMQAYCRRVR